MRTTRRAMPTIPFNRRALPPARHFRRNRGSCAARRGAAACCAALLGVAGTARGQTELPPGLSRANPAPHSIDALQRSEAIAKRYGEVLLRELKPPGGQLPEPIAAALKLAVDDNVRYEQGTRESRQDIIGEIAALENSDELKTPAGRNRLRFLYGQLEQIVLNAPTEPEQTFARLKNEISESDHARIRAALAKARLPLLELPAPADLKDLMPGTATSRTLLAAARYASEKNAGLLTSAENVPVSIDPAEVVQIAIPRYYAPAAPLERWEAAYNTLVKRYRFGEPQLATARAIFDDVRRRAVESKEARKDDYALVASFKNADLRAALLREINRPLDELFEELKQRLAQVATPQQLAEAQKAQPQ